MKARVNFETKSKMLIRIARNKFANHKLDEIIFSDPKKNGKKQKSITFNLIILAVI